MVEVHRQMEQQLVVVVVVLVLELGLVRRELGQNLLLLR